MCTSFSRNIFGKILKNLWLSGRRFHVIFSATILRSTLSLKYLILILFNQLCRNFAAFTKFLSKVCVRILEKREVLSYLNIWFDKCFAFFINIIISQVSNPSSIFSSSQSTSIVTCQIVRRLQFISLAVA